MINTLPSTYQPLAPSRIIRGTALGGIAWNLFGVMRFAASSFKSADQLMAAGMTGPQATLYASLPGWMTLAFGAGVGLGLAGSALLLLRRRAALPVLLVSLAAYAILFAGDLSHGVFAVFGPGQLVVLIVVLAIAAFLAVSAARQARTNRLI